jgi:hypothetical protein
MKKKYPINENGTQLHGAAAWFFHERERGRGTVRHEGGGVDVKAVVSGYSEEGGLSPLIPDFSRHPGHTVEWILGLEVRDKRGSRR